MESYEVLDARFKKRLQDLEASVSATNIQLRSSEHKLNELLQQQDLIERTRVALEQARPLISAASIKQLEALANTALSVIFDITGQIEFDVESKRFVISDETGRSDLAEASGGGLVTVISFVFDLFLLVKQGCRKLLVYDEAFYAVSDAYFEDFVGFVKQACKDLGVDLLLVSHDARLNPSMVDTAYKIENGKAFKIK